MSNEVWTCDCKYMNRGPICTKCGKLFSEVVNTNSSQLKIQSVIVHDGKVFSTLEEMEEYKKGMVR